MSVQSQQRDRSRDIHVVLPQNKAKHMIPKTDIHYESTKEHYLGPSFEGQIVLDAYLGHISPFNS